MIRRLLIANRGEIAVRVARACRELGVESVAVYSEADAGALHVREADRACAIGPAPAAESYLAIGRLIDAARASGAEAVHPGYGFLAENAAFAAACADAGLRFVGPPADVIERMGSKIGARRLMQQAGVPVVPGDTPADQGDEALERAITSVGLPALVKPSAGGGGIGMKIVRDAREARHAVQAARREATAAFGDGTLYVERLVERPRHVEIQVLADGRGGVVHLFERECSLQRRHQKVIEESPSPVLTPALRARMGQAAIEAARAAGYVNAGTVEFLVEPGGPDGARFYFLEMNTRLQVEHPVTECVTGVDLVRAQLAIAGGDALPWPQEALGLRGHAIECRVYAEDPGQQFLPQAGPILRYREPRGPGIRVDAGVAEGSDVPVHYDPLLAKLVVHAETRGAALARAASALSRYAILGVRTNLAFLQALVAHPAVRAGELDTALIERVLPDLVRPDEHALTLAAMAAAAIAPAARARADSADGPPDPWSVLTGWRG